MSLKKYIILLTIISMAFATVIIIPSKKELIQPTNAMPKQAVDMQKVLLKEDERYQGDLLLVNKQNEYNFDTQDKSTLLKLYDFKSDFFQLKDTKILIAKRILEPLNKMLEKFYDKKKVSTTVVLSGYRTKSYQKKLYTKDETQNGKTHAMEYIAKAGYSEHHTGLAVDFGIQYSDGVMADFSVSENAKWIEKNAHKYGFIKRYSENKQALTGIADESWHYRYVGYPHSYYIYKNNLCFEEYITFIQSKATSSFPLTMSYRNATYNIYYTKESTIELPKDVSYIVSGDNQGGYIITTTS